MIPKRQLLLAGKAGVFGLSLWLLSAGGFGFFDVVAFLLIAAILYFKPMFNSSALARSFLLLVIVAPIALSTLEANERYPFLFAAIFGVLFYVLLLIKQNLVLDRASWHYFLFLALFYTMYMLFFAAAGHFIFYSLLAFIATGFMIREFWALHGVASDQRVRLLTLTIAFVSVELLWVVGLLPLGFLNAAAVGLLSLFALLETSFLYLSKSFNARALGIRLGLCGALTLLILLNTSWQIP